MSTDAEALRHLIEAELASVSDHRVLAHVREMLVEPHMVMLGWDYGEPGQRYPCWIVLRDAHSGAKIAYCEFGFGPRCPWGLVCFSPTDQHMGMDSGWFTTFLDAFFDSFACVALPIWRVFRTEPDGARVALTNEDAWDATWSRVYDLRKDDPATRYDCGHSIDYRR
jgi:hypothetical protein